MGVGRPPQCNIYAHRAGHSIKLPDSCCNRCVCSFCFHTASRGSKQLLPQQHDERNAQRLRSSTTRSQTDCKLFIHPLCLAQAIRVKKGSSIAFSTSMCTFWLTQNTADYSTSFYNAIYCAKEHMHTTGSVTNDMRGHELSINIVLF